MSINLNALRDFLRQPTPRIIPPNVRKRALKQRVPFVLALVGFIFIVLGLALVPSFFPWNIADELRLDKNAQKTTGAFVTARVETNMRENNVRVYRYEFSYTTEDGRKHEGVCYRTGETLSSGSRVTVEYLPEKPSVARIQGCRLSPFGWGGGFVAVFPLVGCGLFFFNRLARQRLLRLLSHGRFSTGQIDSVTATNVRVNNQMRYRVTVSFKDDFADRTTHYHAYGDRVALAESKRTSGDTVGVLYDPSNPNRVLLVDELLSL